MLHAAILSGEKRKVRMRGMDFAGDFRNTGSYACLRSVTVNF